MRRQSARSQRVRSGPGARCSTYEGNPDGFPHRTCGFAAGAAPLPVYRWDLIKKAEARDDWVAKGQSRGWVKPSRPGHARDAQCMRETRMVSLIARAASPQVLLLFRYIDGT